MAAVPPGPSITFNTCSNSWLEPSGNDCTAPGPIMNGHRFLNSTRLDEGFASNRTGEATSLLQLLLYRSHEDQIIWPSEGRDGRILSLIAPDLLQHTTAGGLSHK